MSKSFIVELIKSLTKETDDWAAKVKIAAMIAGKDRNWILEQSRKNLEEMGLHENEILALLEKVKEHFSEEEINGEEILKERVVSLENIVIILRETLDTNLSILTEIKKIIDLLDNKLEIFIKNA